jgi:hypothetical protein
MRRFTTNSGLLGAAVVLTTTSSSWATEPPARANVGAFVDLEWRGFAMGGHLSHGPAFAGGVSLWGDHVRVGLAGLGRPGPWNPATFDARLPNGETYKGQRVLSLRSDGGMFGVHVAAALPIAEQITLTVPATLGYGGFGFYLHGEDRNTPDGRRVSEWENELFDGKDSYLGVVLDAGARLHWRPTPTPWLRPYLAGYYTTVPNYTTLVRNDYSGFSFALGIEVAYDSDNRGRRGMGASGEHWQ